MLPDTVAYERMLGLSLLYLGRLEEAELRLTCASVHGDPEAQVELGNVLRLLGRFGEAAAHFQGIEPGLCGELHLRCLRWWGVAEFQAGQTQVGLRRVERAWHGYLGLDNEEWTARVTVSLAQMHSVLGNTRRARLLLTEAVEVLPSLPDPAPRLSALKALAEMQVAGGDVAEATATLELARATLRLADSPRLRALLLSTEAECLRRSGDEGRYRETLEEVHLQATELQDYPLRVWAVSRLAEAQSLAGQHGLALATLLGFGAAPEDWPPEIQATSGVLARRRGDYPGAARDLAGAAGRLRAAGSLPELVRVELHWAAAALGLGEEVTAAQVLQDALSHLLRLRHKVEFRADLEELGELLHFALLEPEVAPYLESLLDDFAHLAGTPRLPEDGSMTVQLTTLGRTAVRLDGQAITFTYAGTAAILAYLILKPGQTRAQMQLDLFPEKDARSGAAYMRQGLKELRDKLGAGVLHFEGPHQAPRYWLGRGVQAEFDVHHLRAALEGGELARALALYRGTFLPTLEHSEWAQGWRDELALLLGYGLRAQLERYQASGDLRRVVLLANQALKLDPHDPELLEVRLRAAEGTAAPHELARYTAEWRRLMN